MDKLHPKMIHSFKTNYDLFIVILFYLFFDFFF